MCGIVGMLRHGGGDEAALTGYVTRMAETLLHRGPDAGGYWTNARAGIAFGHRRLSILDLSDTGAQPMRSDCGRFTVTFNGEIYNHLDIRAELDACGAAPRWRGHSDTETLLYAIRHWGLQGALQRFAGMFAFGLWDESEQSLTLSRDRFGEKPLYYGWCGGDLVFASELKALAAHPNWAPTVDRSALTSFMRYSYVPAPQTIWQGFRKLPSASSVVFGSTTAAGEIPDSVSYWSLRDSVVAAQGSRIIGEREAIEELHRLLSQAIKRQCLSDVPLGGFLSGGIDSSTIVALMQEQSSLPVKTFTIGFSEGAFNEAHDARKVAQHLGTSHTELNVDAKTAIDVIPRLSQMYDEPFADSSQIPTHLVSALARQRVTVALSGDAGDELFGGYNRHVWGGKLNDRFARMPRSLRHALSALLRSVAPEPIGTIAKWAQPLLPSTLRVRRVGPQAAKLALIMKSKSFDEMYQLLSSIDDLPCESVIHGDEQESWSARQMSEINSPLDALDRMTLSDSLSYLTDDILQKVDRAAMSVSLETRVPFLDKDLVEFSARVPPNMKVRAGQGKWLVRQVLYKYVPQHLVDRPKTGFSIPMASWLRGPLKSWACDLLSPDRLRRQGLFDVKRVEQRLQEHMEGTYDHGYWLWNVLMAQTWHDRWHPT